MPRGYGWIRNPKKYVYNKVYNRTSFDIFFIKTFQVTRTEGGVAMYRFTRPNWKGPA